MALKVQRRPDTGALEITGTVRPAGAKTGIRVRRRPGSDEIKLAQEEAVALEREILRTAWHGERPADRQFSEAVVSYLRHNSNASAGTRALIARLLLHFRDTPLSAINQDAVDKARDAILEPDPAPATVLRNLITPLRAILKHVALRGWCAVPVFDVPDQPAGRTAFLFPAQVTALTEVAAPHLKPLLIFLACTGCRMSEALNLCWEEVDLRAARTILWEGETKGGNRRVVNLTPAAVAAIAGLKQRTDVVFRPQRRGRLDPSLPLGYRSSDEGGGGQIRSAWATACRRAGLPGQMVHVKRPDRTNPKDEFRPTHTPHVLRHTWATWHYAVNKDLLLLKQDGGWSSVDQVERYAHLMPVGYDDDIRRVWGVFGGSHGADTVNSQSSKTA
jgi:integrase